MKTEHSILVVAPNWLGDAVMALPFLHALSRGRPGSRIHVLAGRAPASVFRADGTASVIARRGSLAADALALRPLRFAESWLLPNSFRSALTAFLGGASERIGYATDRRAALLTHALPPPPGTLHQLRDYDALLSSRGIEPVLDAPALPIPPEASAAAGRALERAGLLPGPAPVLLAPGAAFSWTKRWPPELWGRLASLLSDAGSPVALVIGPGEEQIAERAAAAAGRTVPVLGADLDPVELAALLARARAVVGNDSGPMHLAGAVGTPVVAIFGPTDPGRTGPSGSASRVLDRYVFCSPCFLKECPYAHECMRGITPEEVLGALTALPARRGGDPSSLRSSG
ncbi:MAG: lipopolysaccharide heptosyltransferase II [Acidobacteriota bacterium]|nr:lipopolysaccharide heptosyltransferase II [Acidobacteriota bacterium]